MFSVRFRSNYFCTSIETTAEMGFGAISSRTILPNSITLPDRISTRPRYMGCRVGRNTPFVIRAVDSSRGLMDVLCILNDLLAARLRMIPSVDARLDQKKESSFYELACEFKPV